MNSSAPQEFEFRPVEESDLPTLTAWLPAPHACRLYQKTPVTLEEVALKDGPFVRDEEPRLSAISRSTGCAVRLCSLLPHAGYWEWVDIIVVNDGISVERMSALRQALMGSWSVHLVRT